VHEGDLRGLAALAEEWRVRRRIVVGCEREPRRVGGDVDILPWRLFIEGLWGGTLVS